MNGLNLRGKQTELVACATFLVCFLLMSCKQKEISIQRSFEFTLKCEDVTFKPESLSTYEIFKLETCEWAKQNVPKNTKIDSIVVKVKGKW